MAEQLCSNENSLVLYIYIDIKLLTPTHKGLNKRIYICEQYAAEFDVKFNGVIKQTYGI